ncbi:MAG: hypothetical protein WAU96_14050 [Anaerolineae bacterium]
MSYGSIDTAFAGVSSRPVTRVMGICATRGGVSFTLGIDGVVEHKNSDARSISDADKCAARIASGLGWARLYLANEGYAIETIYEE